MLDVVICREDSTIVYILPISGLLIDIILVKEVIF